MVQLVKHPTLDFGPGRDLTVPEFEPCTGLYTGSAEPSWDSLSPSPPPPGTPRVCSPPQNKYFIIFFNVYSFLRDRERQSMSGEGAEREGDAESEAGSRL